MPELRFAITQLQKSVLQGSIYMYGPLIDSGISYTGSINNYENGFPNWKP